MTRMGKRLLIGGAFLIGVPLLAAVLALAALVLLHSTAGERWLAVRLGELAASPGQPVTVSGLILTWPLDLWIERIDLGDTLGTWAVLHQTNLQWQPLSLLSAQFAADRLSVGQVEIRRRPLPAPESAEGVSAVPPSLPGLPLALRINALAAEVKAAPAVTGEPLSLAVTGQVSLSDTAIDLGLDIRRSDSAAPQGHVAVDYRKAGPLAVDIALDRPLTGLLISLAAGDRYVPPLDLTVRGNGMLSDWRGTVSGITDGRTCLDGSLRLVRGEALDVLADLGAQPECLPDPSLARALGGAPMALRANVTLADGRLSRIAELRLRSAAGEAAISGTLEERLGLRISLATGELDRLGRLLGLDTGGSLQAGGSISGSLARPAIEVKVISAAGQFAAARWRDLATDLQLTPLPDGGWLAGAVGSAVPENVTGLLAQPVRWSGTVHAGPDRKLFRIPDLRISSASAGAALFGTMAADGGLALRGAARVHRLEPYQSLAGHAVTGGAAAQVAISGNLNGAVTISAMGTLDGFSSGMAQADALLGPMPRWTAHLVSRAGMVPVFAARVTGAQASLAVDGAVLSGMALGWRLDLPDLAALQQPGLAGHMSAQGLVSGPPAASQLAGLAQGVIQRDGDGFGIDLAVGARQLGEIPRGGFHVRLDDARLDAEASGNFEIGQATRLSDLVLTARDARVTGDLRLADGGVSGRLQGRVGDLGRWSELAGVALAGNLEVDARLSHEGRQTVQARVSGNGLQVAGNRIGRLGGQADLSDLTDGPHGTVRLEARDVVAAGTSLRSLDLRAEGAAQSLTFRLDAAGQGDVALAAQGAVQATGDTQTLRLSTLSMQARGVSGRLLQPATVTRDAQGVRVAATRLEVGAGRVELAGGLRGEALDLRLDLSRMPVKLIEPYLPEGNSVVGTLTAQARVGGTLSAPVVSLDTSGQGLGLAGAGRERLEVTAKARWQSQQLALEAHAKGSRGTSLSLEATVPLPTSLSPPPDGAVRGRLRGSGDLGRLTAALPLPNHRFAGALEADITLAGTIGAPDVDGHANLRDGYYEFYDSGTRLRDVQARLTARDARTFALSLSGTDDRRRGKLSGDGRVEVTNGGLSWDVALTVDDFRMVDLDAARARASGHLTFTGLGTEGRLAGTLQLGPAEYHVTEGLFGGGVPTLDVVEINRPGGRPAAAVRKAAPEVDHDEPDLDIPVNIALAIDLGVDRLFVRGDGLESHWQGKLAVGGTARDPAITGELEAVRGWYDLIGRRFDLTDSRVTFDGGQDIDPQLDVTAEASANDITAQVKVSGTVSKPGIEFTSVPELPSDEVLARLLFGRSLGELSVGQQVQLARAAASLTGQGGGFDPIGSLRSGLGLDLLDIGVGEGDSIDPSVTVGKYLDEKTFLRVEEGIGSTGGKAAIERRIGRGLSVEAEVGQQGNGGIGLNWRMDY